MKKVIGLMTLTLVVLVGILYSLYSAFDDIRYLILSAVLLLIFSALVKVLNKYDDKIFGEIWS